MILRNYIRFNAWSIIMVLFLAFSLSSCRDDNFDEPPINGVDPALTVNMTIDSLKRFYQDTVINKNAIPKIDKDWVISGIVTADDKSGNYYKTLVMDDGTAGIAVRLDQSNFNTDFPVGRKIYIKLKGMVIGDYGNLIQLGGFKDTSSVPYSVAAIPASLIRNYIVGGTWGHEVVPYSVTASDLNNTFKWQNRLIKLDNVQFITADTAATWADQVALISVNRTLTDCYGNQMLVRTSGYSSFAGHYTPTGSGPMTAIFSVFVSDKQLILRDESDVDMFGARFVVGTCPPPPATLATIADIRNQYQGASTGVAGALKIRGVVISDIGGNNLDSKNCVIQDGTAGIIVRFTAAHSFALGDSIEVNVSGQTLSEFNGLLEVGGSSPSVPLGNATLLGTGTITPRLVTVNDVVANMSGASDTWESTLIQITGVTFSTSTFGTTTNVTDGTGSVLLYTRSQATFSAAAIPSGATSVTAIVSDFNGLQLSLRNTSDVQ